LKISNELTKKIVKPINISDSEEESVSKPKDLQQNVQIKLETSSKNPWLSFYPVLSETNESETQDNVASIEVYKRPEAYVDRQEIEKAQNEIDSENDDVDETIIVDDDLATSICTIVEISKSKTGDSSIDGKTSAPVEKPRRKTYKKTELAVVENTTCEIDELATIKQSLEIDPSAVLLVDEVDQSDDICAVSTTNNSSSLLVSTNKNEIHRLTISEAFADDDVIEQFKSEKVNLKKNLM
jgi:hypothetical protein